MPQQKKPLILQVLVYQLDSKMFVLHFLPYIL